jgi:hypothetical protein
MAVATLGAWIINELNSLLTQQKLNLEESRLLDCNILETSEGLAAIAAHTCFLTSIALCASESLSCRARDPSLLHPMTTQQPKDWHPSQYLHFSFNIILSESPPITAWILVEPSDNRAMVSSGLRYTPCQPPSAFRCLHLRRRYILFSVFDIENLVWANRRTRIKLEWLLSFLPRPMAMASFAAFRYSSAASFSSLSESRNDTWPKTRISRRCSWSPIVRSALD